MDGKRIQEYLSKEAKALLSVGQRVIIRKQNILDLYIKQMRNISAFSFCLQGF